MTKTDYISADISNEEMCWRTGFYDDDTFCENCPHIEDCSVSREEDME